MSLTNKELVRAFVQGQKNGRNGTGSLHIEEFRAKENDRSRTVLYSYSTPIAIRGFVPCGDLVYMMIDKKFSVTTSNHQRLLREATAFKDPLERWLVKPDNFKEYLEAQGIHYDPWML